MLTATLSPARADDAKATTAGIDQARCASPCQQCVSCAVDRIAFGDTAEVQISVDKTYVPAMLNVANNKDPRELGVRVFHAFIQPAG